MRRSFAVLAVAAMALAVMCGAAFADAAAVASNINSSGLGGSGGLTATANGNTVTVTGTKQIEKTAAAKTMVNLGDLTGVTIDWKADLTVTAGANIHDEGNSIFAASGNGTFKMTDGKIEIVSTPDRKARQVWVFSGSDTEIVLAGGVVSGDHEDDRGFDAPPGLTLDGATVYFPKGLISNRVAELKKNDVENVTGAMPTFAPSSKNDRRFEMFGKTVHTIKNPETLQEEGVHYTLMINKGADVAFTIEDLSTAKTTFGAVVDGKVDFTRIIGRLTSLVVKAGGEAVIADGSITSIDDVILVGGTIVGDLSAAASDPAYGTLDVKGTLTIPAGKTLKLGNINGLKNSGGKVDVKGKIELPSGTSPEQMKKLATALGITGSVFEMNGKTYNDQGEETTSGGGSSSGACTTGAAAVAIAALAIIKRRNK